MESDSVKRALSELLPAMVADGGGAEIIGIGDNSVSLRLIGTCLFCPSRRKSATALAEGLKRRLPELREVLVEYPKIERKPSSGLIPLIV